MSKEDQTIETGDTIGIGNVVGSEAKSEVKINTSNYEGESKERIVQIVIVRVVMFVIGVLGTLLSVVLFIQLLSDVEAQFLFGLILSVFVSILGVLGVIKGENIIEFFGKLFSGSA